MPRARYRRLGLLVVAAALLLASPAQAIGKTIGVNIGVAFWPSLHVTYGVDVRNDFYDGGYLLRLEGHALTYARLVGGIWLSNNPFGVEVGVAIHTPWRGSDVDAALALHLAAGLCDRLGRNRLMLQGSFPMILDGRNAFVGTTGGTSISGQRNFVEEP